MSIDQQYITLCRRILREGKRHENRTSQDTFRLWGAEIRHDLSKSFPLLTTKKIPTKTAFNELLGFVRGITDVRWYRERGCNVWNADHERWHGPDLERDMKRHDELCAKIENGRFTKEVAAEQGLLAESINFRREHPFSLGEIYGAQWRNMNGADQLKDIVTALAKNSNSRRLIMSAWNPGRAHMMCLPPCHISYQFVLDDGKVHIMCWQRSCDSCLGLPFNIANTALLCHLVARASGHGVGELVWYGNDVHIYENQIGPFEQQLIREPRQEPRIHLQVPKGTMPWDVNYEDILIEGYNPHPAIKMPLTVS